MLSGDEVLLDGHALRAFCEQHRSGDAGAYLLGVRFGPRCFYSSARLARSTAGWRYVGRAHEVLVDSERRSAKRECIGPTILHDRPPHPEASRRRWERDLELLREDHAADPENPRYVYYLAQTLDCLGRVAEASRWYETRTNMGGWSEEVFYSLYRHAGCRAALGDNDGALRLFLRAHSVQPDRAEPLYRIARFYHRHKDHALTYLFAARAAQIPMPKGLRLFVDPPVYEHLSHELVGISAYYVGEYENGRRSAAQALLHHPEQTHLQRNIGHYYDTSIAAPASHAVLVVGTGRCGSSAVAGMLAAYGIPMGDTLIEPDATNPEGFHEDAPFVALNCAIGTVSEIAKHSMARYLRYRCKDAVWGVKDPRLCNTWPVVVPLLPCPFTVVHVTRDLDATVASYNKAYGPRPDGWRELIETRARRVAKFASQSNAVEVAYESLLEDPAGQLLRILSRLPATCRQGCVERAAATIKG
jgi:tetratricopeptide (TPR) repeat protein